MNNNIIDIIDLQQFADLPINHKGEISLVKQNNHTANAT